jgi:hypothetical protein
MTPPPARGGAATTTAISATQTAAVLDTLPNVDLTKFGAIVVAQLACNPAVQAPPGVKLEVSYVRPSDTQPIVLYLAGPTQFIPNATETPAGGSAVAVNVQPGNVRVQTKFALDDRIIGDLTVEVRAGWLTFVGLIPTPLGPR